MNISKNMLYCSADALAVIDTDEDRNPIFGEGVTLENVYINYYLAQSDTSNGKEPAGAGVLYFDVQNSRPNGFIFSKGMKLIIDNESYTVFKIAPFRNSAGLEHYEVEFK